MLHQTLPPLPPLTPIAKLQTIRKTPPTQIEQQQQQQHVIPYKNIIHTSASTINLPKSNTILKNAVCFVTTDDEDMNFMPSNMKLLRQNSIKEHQQSQQHCSNSAPKKSLPHKKRITKKLKSISPNVDQMQASVDSYHIAHQPHSHHHHHNHHDISHSMHRHSTHQEQSYSVVHHHHSQQQQQQNETLNLTLNSQPIQLTTTRIDAHNQSVNGSTGTTNQTEFITSDQFDSQIHQISMTETGITTAVHGGDTSTIQTVARFACELCGMQAETQLSFYNHLKLHYEPDVPPAHSQSYKLTESIRNVQHQNAATAATSIDTSVLVLEQNDQHMFHLTNGSDERKISVQDQCIGGQTITSAQPVIMSDSHSFVRVQNSDQDFSCISDIGQSDVGADNDDGVDDDASIAYNDTGLVGIKSEQNEFSDTEDMLENGVLDKVQRVVDSYIENGTSDVKNLIDMNENQHHSSLVVDGTCNWNSAAAAEAPTTGGNVHSLSNNTVYNIDKNEPVDPNINANSFVITTTTAANNQNKEASHAAVASVTQNHIINDGAVIARPEELTLIYGINVNDKDFPIIDDTSSESKRTNLKENV